LNIAKLEAVTPVTVKIVFCCDVTPSGLIDLYRRFGRTFCFKLQGKRMKVETAGSSESSVNLYKATVIALQKPVTLDTNFYWPSASEVIVVISY
jgi:hypothetical protein